jgi:uncharacterized protein
MIHGLIGLKADNPITLCKLESTIEANARESAAQTRDRAGQNADAHTVRAQNAGSASARQGAKTTNSGESKSSLPMKRILLLLTLVGCNRTAEPEALIRFDTGSIVIHTPTDTVRMQVEIADTDTKREYGLMDRTSVAPESGMLFVYNAPQDSATGFWMYRTKVPLDIAFIDPNGVIGAILPMDPCTSPEPRWCTPYPAGIRYQSALEVNRGFFQSRGIGVGSKVQREH